MDLAWLHSIFTVLVVSAFIAIVIWAYGGKRKRMFDQAARQPLDERDTPLPPGDRRE